MRKGMDYADLKGAVAAIAAAMAKNMDCLVELDQQNGDGDLGISMAEGYGAVASWLAANDEPDLGKALMRCSTIFNEKAPSTLGTITSFFLMGMAKPLKGRSETGPAELATAMEAGLTLVQEKAKSKPGEKTILDSIAPAVAALKAKALAGEGFAVCLAAAAKAAAEGSEATRGMRSVHGRAAYYGDKSVGVIDGGSVVGRLVFESLASYCAGSAE